MPSEQTTHLSIAPPSMAAPVSVVIVNFNAGAYLAAAVESALAQSGLVGEVVVVDNDSADRSLAMLAARVPDARVRTLRLPRNLGFAEACNRGLAETAGPLVLFLNPDCRMRPGSLAALVSELDVHAHVGMAGPLVVNPDGSEQRGCRRDIPTPWQIFCVAFGLHRLMPAHPRFRAYTRESVPLPSRPELVPAISGACMLVRRAAIGRVGTLDPAFFLHFEDLDWCLRFEKAGQGVLFVPAAVVEHTQGVCSASRPLRSEAAKHRSLVRFLRKNFTGFYPSSFMTAVSGLVALRFGWIALGILAHRRRRRSAWEALLRGPTGSPARPGAD
jgi:GT2 family glycosyltransferase